MRQFLAPVGRTTPLINPFFTHRLTVARSTLRSLATSAALRNSFINSTIGDTPMNVNIVVCCVCCISYENITLLGERSAPHLMSLQHTRYGLVKRLSLLRHQEWKTNTATLHHALHIKT